jgi:hypothetical protein
MCSPVGHSVVGVAIGLLVILQAGCGMRTYARTVWRRKGLILLFVFLANSPDVDYLPGLISGDLNHYHHQVTHSLVWVSVFSLGIWLMWRALDRSAGVREFIYVCVAAASHLLVDMLTQDGAAPYGIMLLWPFSTEYMQAPFWVFGMMAKNDLRMVFQWSNFFTMLRELLLTVPLVLAVIAVRFFHKSAT